MKLKNINKRDGFTFFNSVYNATKKLNDKQLALFMRTFLDVQFLEKRWDNVSFDDPLLDMMWTNMVNTVESQIDGYLANKDSNKHQFIGVYYKDTPPSYPPYDAPPKEVQGEVQVEVQGEVQNKATRIDKLSQERMEDLNKFMIEYCEDHDIDLIEIDKFIDYWKSTNKNATKTDWKATFRNHCRNDWVKKTKRDNKGGGWDVY